MHGMEPDNNYSKEKAQSNRISHPTALGIRHWAKVQIASSGGSGVVALLPLPASRGSLHSSAPGPILYPQSQLDTPSNHPDPSSYCSVVGVLFFSYKDTDYSRPPVPPKPPPRLKTFQLILSAKSPLFQQGTCS